MEEKNPSFLEKIGIDDEFKQVIAEDAKEFVNDFISEIDSVGFPLLLLGCILYIGWKMLT